MCKIYAIGLQIGSQKFLVSGIINNNHVLPDDGIPAFLSQDNCRRSGLNFLQKKTAQLCG